MKNRAAFKRTSKGPRSHKLSGGARVSYTATEAKHEFGQVLEKAIHGATVVITRHNALRAVLISMDQFKALQDAPQMKLDTLSEQFDALLDRVQHAKRDQECRSPLTHPLNSSEKLQLDFPFIKREG
jgi:prevent-host-death family protein